MAEKLVESKNSGKLTTTTYEFPYMRKPPAKKTLGQIIYDNEKGKVLGRTPKSWREYYCIFKFIINILWVLQVSFRCRGTVNDLPTSTSALITVYWREQTLSMGMDHEYRWLTAKFLNFKLQKKPSNICVKPFNFS